MIRDLTKLERIKLKAKISGLFVLEQLGGQYRPMIRAIRSGLTQRLELGCEIVGEDLTDTEEKEDEPSL